jgi:hypothetical protein
MQYIAGLDEAAFKQNAEGNPRFGPATFNTSSGNGSTIAIRCRAASA